MENGSAKCGFQFQEKKELHAAAAFTVRAVLDKVMENLNNGDDDDTCKRTTIHLGHGDPSAFPSFRTTPVAEEAIVHSLRSANFNCYAPGVGILPARSSLAEYLSKDLPYKLTADDVFLTVGANHAIEVVLAVLARPSANILLPKPGYPYYEARAAFSHLEVRHFDLLPDKGWEVDIDGIEALADDKTVAIVIINPGNPCGNVFTSAHVQKVAETARKLGILVISDEVYGHLAYGSTPFFPMGRFGSIAPVLTLGSLSKRWIIPGWRLGWIAITDPNGLLQKSEIASSIKSYLSITSDSATFIQGAVPQILKKTEDSFFVNINKLLKEAADMFYKRVEEMPGITCPYKPEGAMSTMVKLNLTCFDRIHDDMDFCIKLAKEESMIILPGVAVGLKNWVRITYAVEPKALEDALERMKAFCLRHAKKL